MPAKKTKKQTAKKKATPAAKKKPAGLSPTDFAKKVGVTRQRILQAIKDGVISESVTAEKKGSSTRYLINEAKGIKEWADNIDPAKQRDVSKMADTKSMGKGEMSNYQRAKAAKEFYGAKMAQLEFEERSGKLIPANRVKAEAFKIGRRVRDTIMGVPERVSAELAVMDDPRTIAIYLKEQLALALKDLGDINNVGNPRDR